jgi:CRP-like cAMP-binding protein
MTSAPATNPLTMKLEQFTSFSSEDRQRLDELAAGNQRRWAPKRDILRDGEHVDHILLVLSGFAVRNKMMPDGKRQITAFLIPGDLCDVEVFVLAKMDHAVTALTQTTCALIPTATMKGMLTDMGGLTQALWWSTMTDSAVLRERIIDFGQRGARERLAHLFYELLIRYRLVGMAPDNSYPFPATQEDLADATGMTPVHVNRMLQVLRADNLIDFTGKVVKVRNVAELKKTARFNADYLHLRPRDGLPDLVASRAGDLI